jgi:hypothetical protein
MEDEDIKIWNVVPNNNGSVTVPTAPSQEFTLLIMFANKLVVEASSVTFPNPSTVKSYVIVVPEPAVSRALVVCLKFKVTSAMDTDVPATTKPAINFVKLLIYFSFLFGCDKTPCLI